MVERLDAALLRFEHVARRDLGADVGETPGSGAAGGLGAGIMAFLGGSLRPGVDIVLDTVGLDSYLEGADLVITGEGCMDFQTVYNKAPIGVARLAGRRGVPVIGVSGSLGDRFTDVHEEGIAAAVAITRAPMTLDGGVRSGRRADLGRHRAGHAPDKSGRPTLLVRLLSPHVANGGPSAIRRRRPLIGSITLQASPLSGPVRPSRLSAS